MQVCTKCGASEPQAVFSWKKKGVLKSSRCVMCQREYGKTHYKEHRAKYIQNAKERTPLARDALHAITLQARERPCADCKGMFPWWVMDFDHLDPSKKQFSVAHFIRKGTSKERLLEEISKCEVVCSNCHRNRTYMRLCSDGGTRQTRRLQTPVSSRREGSIPSLSTKG